MEGPNSRSPDGMPIFDTLDLDLVVKVLAHTAFSEFPEPHLQNRNLKRFKVHSSYSSSQSSTSSKGQSSLTQ